MDEGFYDEGMAAQQDRLAATPDMSDQRARLVATLAPRAGQAVLELGTGNGALLRDIAPRLAPGGQATGLDTSPQMLEIARHLAPDAEFVEGSAEALPFDEACFDAICAAQVLCFLEDVDTALSEAFRVLRPGGRVVLLDTDWATLVWHSRKPALMRRLVEAYTAHYADAHLPRTLAPRLAMAGFESISCESFVLLNRTLSEETYARQTLAFAVSIMESSSDFSGAEIDQFATDQDELAETGATFFSLNRYIFSAKKPR